MSLFQCYGSDSEDDDDEKDSAKDLDSNSDAAKYSINFTNVKNVNDKDYSEYDSVGKLSIEKVLQKPYGIRVEENDLLDENAVGGARGVEMEDCEPDKDLVELENMDDEARRKKKPRYLEPVYAMRNNLIHTTLENSTPPISSDSRTPPTPTLYSPPYISNPPTSTNPNFTGLYPNISSPPNTTSFSSASPDEEGDGTDANDNSGNSSKDSHNNTEQDEIDRSLKEKIIKLHHMKQDGLNFNDSLRNSIAFNNPLILEKLISFCEIKENGTNLPTDYFNPNAAKPDEFYDRLEVKQREMEERKEKERMRIDTPPKPTIPQVKKKSNWNKYSQAATTAKPAVVTKSVKVGAVITSAPTIVKKKEEEKPAPQINSIFKRRK